MNMRGMLKTLSIVTIIGAFAFFGAQSIGVKAQSSATITHTTVEDFSTCSTTSNTSIANSAGGEIRLQAALEDYFEGPNVDPALWTIGYYNPGYVVPPRIEKLKR